MKDAGITTQACGDGQIISESVGRRKSIPSQGCSEVKGISKGVNILSIRGKSAYTGA